MAAPWSCAVTPSWGPSKSSWSSNSSSICRRNHHHASPRQQRRFPSHPTPCSGDFRDASVDIAHFFTPVEKVGLIKRAADLVVGVPGLVSLQVLEGGRLKALYSHAREGRARNRP